MTDVGPHHVGNTSGSLWTPSKPDGSNRAPYGYQWRFDIGVPWALNTIRLSGIGNLQDTGGGTRASASYDYSTCAACRVDEARVQLLRGNNVKYTGYLTQQDLQNGGITISPPGSCLALKPGNYSIVVTPGQVTSTTGVVPDAVDDFDWSSITLSYTGSASGVSCSGSGGGGTASPVTAHTPNQSPYIFTQVAGSGIPLTIAVYKNGSPDTNFQGTVTASVLNATNNTGTLNTTTGCRSSWAPVTGITQVVVFNKQSTANTTLPADPGVLRDAVVELQEVAANGKTATVCVGNHFAIRPDHFTVKVTNAAGNQLSAVTAGGSPTATAGAAFRVAVTAYNSQGRVTSGYQGSPQATASATVLGPNLGTLSVPSSGWSASNGTVTNSQAVYSEVGAFRMAVKDANFASVDNSDPESASQRNVPAVDTNVGRFIPADFKVSVGTAPRFATACSGFTYIGQPFHYATAPVADVTAVNAQGATTTNYTGSLFKLSGSSVTGQTYSDGNGHAVDTGSPPAPTVKDQGGGKGTITFATDPSGVAMTRSEPPVLPYNADLSFSFSLKDGDGVAYSGNPFAFDGGGSGIPFTSGAQMRYGRMLLVNAYGSQKLPLRVPIRVQYYADLGAGNKGFAMNSADTCTTGSAISPSSDITLDETYLGNGSSGQTKVTSVAINKGVGQIMLSSPAPATGKVGVDLNLNPSYYWLMPDTNGNGSYQDPTAIASFGLYYRHHGKAITVYRREVVR